MVDRLQGSSGLGRDAALKAFVDAQRIEQGVRERLSRVDKGRVLKTLLIVLPAVTTVVGILGGFFTVYSSTDCRDSDFGVYSRVFLYTSLSYTITNLILDKSIGMALLRLMRYPGVAFPVYCAQALVTACFLVAMLVLLGLMWRAACPSVVAKIKQRLYQ
ncbi:hypothetical protein WJX74_007992 [Apatococcus lobatus]|uniref:Uncharacterized protein n=1 Tax=Apatococcus lobatus TaxID=904363 RepID=A0AAW1Q660_9CHLO